MTVSHLRPGHLINFNLPVTECFFPFFKRFLGFYPLKAGLTVCSDCFVARAKSLAHTIDACFNQNFIELVFQLVRSWGRHFSVGHAQHPGV